MNWEVFTELSNLPTQVHWLLALLAFVLGSLILSLKKGTRLHVALGRSWVGIMLVVALTALLIRNKEPDEAIWLGLGFSYIHLLIPVTVGCLYLGVKNIRRGNVKAHRMFMIVTFSGSLILAGALTLLPGRHMHTLLFAEKESVQSLIESGVKK